MSRANSWINIKNDQGHTELVRYDMFVKQLLKAGTREQMIMHVALGISGEAGEFADAIKNEFIYCKPTNLANIVEELGDLRFYIQAAMQMYGIDEQTVLQANTDKLAKRYAGLVFSNEAAQNRADKQE